LLLTILHERLGVRVWEVPGGHVDSGESFEEAAARETAEETGVSVTVGSLAATCIHEWTERRQRRVILFYWACPERTPSLPRRRVEEARIERVEWKRPESLTAAMTTPFLHPLLARWDILQHPDHEPLFYKAEHHRYADGMWRPRVISSVGGLLVGDDKQGH
jgi:ADP-ribose pyrophosphatase YjhB (NUDIX family)